MSINYGIGDALAVVNLIERVVVELRAYRDAPRHFQHLAVELQLLQRALHRLLEIEPCDDSDLQQLEEIKAIATHCRQPLLDFINKMRPSETYLGPIRSTGTLSSIGKRLHWSLLRRKDVEGLRQAAISELTAINMLLAVQQLDSIRKLISAHDEARSSATQLREFCSVSEEYFVTTMEIMKQMRKTSGVVEQFSDVISRRLAIHDQSTHQINKDVTAISTSLSSLTVCTRSVSKLTRGMEGYILRVLRTVVSLASDLGKVVVMIGHLSKRFAKKFASQGKLLLEIHVMMKRILRAVEAIPLHITLPIIRLDDALGESWALPYQACQTYQSFQDILQALVFGNGRVGALRVALGLFLLRSTESRQLIDSGNWQQVVREGSRVSQAMVVCGDRIGYPSPDFQNHCPFPYCSGRMIGNGGSCVLCGRIATLVSELPAQSADYGSNRRAEILEPDQGVHGPKSIRLCPPEPLYSPLGGDGAFMFRDITFTESTDANSTPSPFHLISKNPLDPTANESIGRWMLSEETAVSPTGLGAAAYLIRACFISPFDAEKYYRLGRAFSRQQNWSAALNAYKRALFLQPRSPTIWMSGGILFFSLGLFRKALMVFARCVRLDHEEVSAWLNIGILYERCGQNNIREAIESYQVYLQKRCRYEYGQSRQEDPYDYQAHIDELGQYRLQDKLPSQVLHMMEPDINSFSISLSGPTDEFLSPLEQQLLHPNRLNLDESAEEGTILARLLELDLTNQEAEY